MSPVRGPARLAERTAAAHEQAAGMVEAEIEQQLARVRRDLPIGRIERARLSESGTVATWKEFAAITVRREPATRSPV